MAAVVYLFLFIVSILSITEANRVKKKLPKLSARRDGLGVDPKNSRGCLPGGFYNGHNCEQCFCNENKIKICTVPLTCKIDEELPSRNDLIHVFNPATLSSLPKVMDVAARCDPGKSYRIDCNRCICTKSKSLMCENLLCPSYDDVNRLKAKEMSGQPCHNSDTNRQNCVQCECKNGITDCDFKKNCDPLESLKTLKYKGRTPAKMKGEKEKRGKGKKCIPGQKYMNGPLRPPCICTNNGRLQCSTALILPKKSKPLNPAFFDATSGKKCTPGVVYKKDCNRCTCTQKKHLRCTTMTCIGDETLARLRKRKPRLLAFPEAKGPKSLAGKRGAKKRSSTRPRISKKKLPFDPAFLDGKKCKPGVMYQRECNKCSCTQHGAILCTTMACPSKKDVKTLMKLHQKFDKDYE